LLLIFVFTAVSLAQPSDESRFSDYWSKRLIEVSPQSAHYFIPRDRAGDYSVQRALIMAYSYQSADWNTRALKSYAQAISEPSSPPAMDWAAFWLGDCIQSSGRPGRLREVFSTRSPPWGNFWLAVWHFSNSEYDSAATLFASLSSGKSGQAIMRLMAGYLQGVSLGRLGATDSSRVVFINLLQKYPRSLLEGEINYRIGAGSFARGEWETCREHLETAISFYDFSSRKSAHWWADEALFLLGAVDFMEGRHLAAMRGFDRLRHRFPDSPYIGRLPYLSLLGEIETRATQASQDSALLAQLSPDLYADVLLRIGYLFMQDGELAAAQAQFLRSADIAEDMALVGECNLFAGECAYRRRRYREAIGYYQLAFDCCENRRRETSWGLGWCYLRTKQYEEARMFFATVFSGFDDDFAERARSTYAETFLLEGRPGRAASELRDFLNTCRGDVCDDALYNLILAYEALGNTEKVEESAWQFLTSYRRSPLAEKVVPKLADILYKRKGYTELIRLADKVEAYAVSRETADRTRVLAEHARYHLGIYTDPLEITDKFLEKYPDSPLVGELLIDIGGYLCEIGDYEKGAIAFDRLRKRNIPDSLWVEASYRMGHCYLGMGDTVAASEIFGQLLGEFPESPLAARGVIALGDYYAAENLLERAVATYNNVLENAKDSTQLELAELRLARSYEGLERFTEARILYTSLTGETGANPYVWFEAFIGLLRVNYKMAEYERGFELAKIVYDTLSNDSIRCMIGEKMGMFAVRLGEIDRAFDVLMPHRLDSCFCSGSDDQTVLYDLSLALEFRDKIEDAKQVWLRMVETSTDDSIVALAREKLKEYGGPLENNENEAP